LDPANGGNRKYGDFPYIPTGNHLSLGPTRPMVLGLNGDAADLWVYPIVVDKVTVGGGMTGDTERAGFGSWHPGVCNFLLGDGSVRGIANTTGKTILKGYAAVSDGETVSLQ
jgi:prepilin-type processing-associated H-X9-DG protein